MISSCMVKVLLVTVAGYNHLPFLPLNYIPHIHKHNPLSDTSSNLEAGVSSVMGKVIALVGK